MVCGPYEREIGHPGLTVKNQRQRIIRVGFRVHVGGGMFLPIYKAEQIQIMTDWLCTHIHVF